VGNSGTLLSVKDLTIQYVTDEGTVQAVNHVSFASKGQDAGLVARPAPARPRSRSASSAGPNPPGRIVGGAIELDGRT